MFQYWGSSPRNHSPAAADKRDTPYRYIIPGSKNKIKTFDDIDYAGSKAKSIAQEIAALGDKIDALNAERKAKETELKKLNKEIVKFEAKKVTADQKAAEEAKQARAVDLVKQALANGTTADEILELLK